MSGGKLRSMTNQSPVPGSRDAWLRGCKCVKGTPDALHGEGCIFWQGTLGLSLGTNSVPGTIIGSALPVKGLKWDKVSKADLKVGDIVTTAHGYRTSLENSVDGFPTNGPWLSLYVVSTEALLTINANDEWYRMSYVY